MSKKTGKFVLCLTCKKSFWIKGFYLKTGRGKFCSRVCYGKSRIGIIPVNKNQIERKCFQCERIFSITLLSSQKYCSKACYMKDKISFKKQCIQCQQCFIVNCTNKDKQFCNNSCAAKYRVLTFHPTRGKKLSKITKNKISKSHMGIIAGILAVPKKDTSIEKILFKYLDTLNIIYKKQYNLDDKFMVDAYIPSLRMVIEADGKYWHSLPKQIIRDNVKIAYCQQNNYNLIRLSEDEINNDSFQERLVI